MFLCFSAVHLLMLITGCRVIVQTGSRHATLPEAPFVLHHQADASATNIFAQRLRGQHLGLFPTEAEISPPSRWFALVGNLGSMFETRLVTQTSFV